MVAEYKQMNNFQALLCSTLKPGSVLVPGEKQIVEGNVRKNAYPEN